MEARSKRPFTTPAAANIGRPAWPPAALASRNAALFPPRPALAPALQAALAPAQPPARITRPAAAAAAGPPRPPALPSLPGRPLQTKAGRPVMSRPAPTATAGRLLQARMDLKHGGASDLVGAIRKSKILPVARTRALGTEIGHMIASHEHFGEVDIRNPQQVALVAYRLAKQRFTAPVLGAPRSRDGNRIFKLAIVGAGSTAAYYIDTLGPAYDHADTIIIGGANPWHEERGHAIPYINHTARQIAMPSANVTAYGGNESFVNRRAFARDADRVIAAAHGTWLREASVERISLRGKGELAGKVYHIHLNGGRVVRASKVIFAGGSGAMRTPAATATEPVVHNRHRIINMNEFVRSRARSGPKGNVVIWGNNAAIDAVAAAKRHGWTVVQWLYSEANRPTWLPGSRYRSPPYSLHLLPQHAYKGRNDITIEDDGDKLQVKDRTRPEPIARHVDYLVYGLGSDDLLAGDRAIIDKSVMSGPASLTPILDDAGLFGERRAPRAERAFLGWQNGRRTFQVLGLAAENYEGAGGRVNSATDARVQTLKGSLSGDVAAVGQLTYIRSAVRAINNFVPGSIVERLDYSHADANQVAIHIAAKYPQLSAIYTQRFIAMLRTVREGLGERLPHGFTASQTKFLDRELHNKNRQFKQQSIAGGTGVDAWIHWLGSQLRNMTPAAGAEVARGMAKLAPNLV
jgi:hypothetical protein